MLNFTYHVPTKIYFGRGQLKRLGPALKDLGASRVLLLYGGGSVKRSGLYDQVVAALRDAGVAFVDFGGVRPNPRVSHVRAAAAACRKERVDAVLAVGGGSVIDAGKAVAAAVYYDGDPWDFCVGRAEVKRALPLAAVLTLAATGSEMNAGAVISNDETREKLPMFGGCLKPRFSILDPTFTFTLPPRQTAAGVADVISHCFEQYFSPTPATYLADRLAEAVIRTCVAFGPQALARPDDYDARAELMWASSWGLNDLLSCGKEGDWAVHMVEHELSALNDLSHGVGLAILTPAWLRFVADTPARVAKVAAYGRNVWRLDGSDDGVAAAAIEKTASFFTDAMKLPATLGEVGFNGADLAVAAKQATRFGPLGRFRELNEGDVAAILRAAR